MGRCVWKVRKVLEEKGPTLFMVLFQYSSVVAKKNQKAHRYPADQPKFESGTLSTTLECH
jgi:hypothetical protein